MRKTYVLASVVIGAFALAGCSPDHVADDAGQPLSDGGGSTGGGSDGGNDGGVTDAGGGSGQDGGPDLTGAPKPGANDTILVDTRTTLQQATDLTDAFAAFPGNDHSDPRAAPGQDGWTFNTNFDGKGTHALVANWHGPTVANGMCEDQRIIITGYLPDPKVKKIFIQWKQRLGRSPNDTDSNGAVDSFVVGSTTCHANIGRKEMLLNTDPYTDRYDYTWQLNNDVGGPNGVVNPTLESGFFVAGTNQPDGDSFNVQAHVGETIQFTLYWEAATTNMSNDGTGKLWINGQLVSSHNDLALKADPFLSFDFPTIFNTPSQDQSEYFWDVLVWTPN